MAISSNRTSGPHGCSWSNFRFARDPFGAEKLDLRVLKTDRRLLHWGAVSCFHFIPHDRKIGFTSLVEQAIVTLVSPQQR
jgi:hypothetical protein